MTLDEVVEKPEPVHLLLIADTKAGKSTYTALAAKAGFTLVYFDHDNGVSALRNTLRGDQEAMRRVNYFYIENPKLFWYQFLRSTTKNPLIWNSRTQRQWGPATIDVQPDDELWMFDVTKIPASWVLCLDSWTAFAADALDIGSASAKAELLEGTNQGIYGEANGFATYVVNVLQKISCHVLVQAHGTRYEIYEKPKNKTSQEAKQKDMILLETVEVPKSTSRPHGQDMASRFNHIGWLDVDHVGTTHIDFTRRPNRVGGGPPNKRAPVSQLGFEKLVGKVPAPEEGEGWFRKTTHAELLAEREAAKAQAKPATPSLPAAGTTIAAPAATQAVKPAAISLASMMKK